MYIYSFLYVTFDALGTELESMVLVCLQCVFHMSFPTGYTWTYIRQSCLPITLIPTFVLLASSPSHFFVSFDWIILTLPRNEQKQRMPNWLKFFITVLRSHFEFLKCDVSQCYHPNISFLCFLKSSSGKGFVSMSATISVVGQYSISTFPFSTIERKWWYRTAMCFVLGVRDRKSVV